jgi:hypothetical protein
MRKIILALFLVAASAGATTIRAPGRTTMVENTTAGDRSEVLPANPANGEQLTAINVGTAGTFTLLGTVDGVSNLALAAGESAILYYATTPGWVSTFKSAGGGGGGGTPRLDQVLDPTAPVTFDLGGNALAITQSDSNTALEITSDGIGLSVTATADRAAIIGDSALGRGVVGSTEAADASGVQGINGSTGFGVFGLSFSGVSGFFQSSDAANTAGTVVSKQQGASTADLFQAQDAGGIAQATIAYNGQITSALPTGTAPLVVASTTAVANLTLAADSQLPTISTAAKVSNSATTATTANTASTIVLRDGSGNFAAGTITAGAFVGPFTGHLITGGSTPGVSACGGSPAIAGTDNAGRVTVGSGGGTVSCTVTFAATWTNAPACTTNNETTANLARATATTSTLTIAGTFVAADKLTFVCVGF